MKSGNRKTGSAIAVLVAVVLLASCAVGPRYSRPTAQVPSAYKELPQNWKVAQPADASIRGNWWEIYHDPELNTLEEKINVSNQNLKIAQAQFMQARALVRINRSQYFPTVTGGVSASRTHQSQNRPLARLSNSTFTDLVLPIDASYEPDVWGRVRKTVEASRANAQASAADLESVSLTLHAELAVDYFLLRANDAEQKLLDSTVSAFEQALSLTVSRFKGGVASEVDVAQAQTQLETTRAQAIDLREQRALLEHAIAVLTGQPPATFSLAFMPLNTEPPVIPTGLPSQLLERRPDIAATERLVAGANANIGVAKAAYFPLFSLTATGGFESALASNWFSGPSGLVAAAASSVVTVFDAGRRHAVSDQAWGAFNQSVATYRQTVLGAFQDVEDNLASTQVLEDESKMQAQAVVSAQHSLDLSISRYRGGVTTYLEVITAQSTALTDERTAVQILGRRMTASVLLVKALGGGWNSSSIPQNPECCGRLQRVSN
jgi:NodT family efflux transporter outer membrane factor (OMF) lipoprotein